MQFIAPTVSWRVSESGKMAITQQRLRALIRAARDTECALNELQRRIAIAAESPDACDSLHALANCNTASLYIDPITTAATIASEEASLRTNWSRNLAAQRRRARRISSASETLQEKEY